MRFGSKIVFALASGLAGCTGLLHQGATNQLALKLNNGELPWNLETVKGNVDNPVITGVCGKGLEKVNVMVDNTPIMEAMCVAGSVTVPFPAGSFTNADLNPATCAHPPHCYDLYSIKFSPVALKADKQDKALSVTRIYSYRKIDPNLLSDFPSSIPPSPLASEILTGSCEKDLTYKLKNTGTGTVYSGICTGTTLSIVVPLVIGANNFNFQWGDAWQNIGTRNFTITRAAASAPVLISGMPSFTPYNVQAAATHDGVICAAGDTYDATNHRCNTKPYIAASAGLAVAPMAVTVGFPAANMPTIPLAWADSGAPVSPHIASIAPGNLSLMYCENMSAGNCVP